MGAVIRKRMAESEQKEKAGWIQPEVYLLFCNNGIRKNRGGIRLMFKGLRFGADSLGYSFILYSASAIVLIKLQECVKCSGSGFGAAIMKNIIINMKPEKSFWVLNF